MDPCPCPLGVSQGLGGGEIEDVDGVTFGVVGGVFEGDFAFGDGVVGRRLHQAVDKDRRETIAVYGLGQSEFTRKVNAVDSHNWRLGEGDIFLRGHDLAIGKRQADDGLGGGASAGGVAGVDTRDRQGGLADLDGGAFLGDGRHILATLGTAAGDRLECAAHNIAYSVVNLFTC